MSSEKNKYKLRPLDAYQHELGNAGNFGRKLLEKMGWQDGLGLGRNNQGMVENPLWKYRRNEHFKGGFKTKDEVFERDVLVHQNAFEDLLGDLNAQICEESEVLYTPNLVSRASAKVSTRQPRYFKMTRAKDTSNYSIKDLEGIIGREVTKKNLSLLQQDKKVNKTISNTESNKYRSSVFKNRKYCNIDKPEFLEIQDKLSDCDRTETTVSSTCSSSCNNYARGYSAQDHNLIKRKDTQFTLEDKVDKVKMKKLKKKKIRGENVEINTSADQCLNIVHEDLTVKEENLSKDADTRITHEYLKVDKVKIKKHKKRNKNREEKVDIKPLTDPILNIVHENLTVKEDNLSKDSWIELEDLKVDEVKMKKHKRKRNREENVKINTGANTSLNIENENMKVKKDNFSKVDNQKKFCCKESKKVHAEDEDLVSQICQGFIGSNLSSIKGYGNW